MCTAQRTTGWLKHFKWLMVISSDSSVFCYCLLAERNALVVSAIQVLLHCAPGDQALGAPDVEAGPAGCSPGDLQGGCAQSREVSVMKCSSEKTEMRKDRQEKKKRTGTMISTLCDTGQPCTFIPYLLGTEKVFQGRKRAWIVYWPWKQQLECF